MEYLALPEPFILFVQKSRSLLLPEGVDPEAVCAVIQITILEAMFALPAKS